MHTRENTTNTGRHRYSHIVQLQTKGCRVNERLRSRLEQMVNRNHIYKRSQSIRLEVLQEEKKEVRKLFCVETAASPLVTKEMPQELFFDLQFVRGRGGASILVMFILHCYLVI